MEQIISAIDDIKGTVEWRRRELMDGNQSNRQRKYLADLVNLTLVCDEGRSGDLITAAMAVGAAGATISKTGSITFAGKESSSISPAREVGEMIVSATQVQPIREALMKCGAFDDNTHGLLYSSPVTMACTYLGQPKN
jgi:hypothetical protein